MLRALLPIAVLIHAGCYTTASYRAADPDTLDDVDLAALERCQAECRGDTDRAACFAACPNVSLADGSCDNSDVPEGLCVDNSGWDRDSSLLGLGVGAGVAGLAAMTVITVFYAQGLADATEAALNTVFPPESEH